MVVIKSKWTDLIVAVVLVWGVRLGGLANSSRNSDEVAPPAYREIHLSKLGYKPSEESQRQGSGIPRDLSVLYDDGKKRLAFIDRKIVSVYYSDQTGTTNTNQPHRMEAFFIDTDSGALISRQSWVTRERRWFNERWDTQARILPVYRGYVVHAGNTLISYSAAQEERAKLSLEPNQLWSVAVPPFGHTVHLQRIKTDAEEAQGEWLTSDKFQKIRDRHEHAGITSASNEATIDKLAHCLQLQKLEEPPRDLCCHDACRLGLPKFLSDDEVLSAYPNGFAIISTTGEKLWERSVQVSKTRIISSVTESLDGSRFAILLWADHDVVFDSIKVHKGQPKIVVYDRSERNHVFALPLGSVAKDAFTFALASDGGSLAVLLDDMVRVYQLPRPTPNSQ